MYVSLISEEDKVVPAKVVICDFPLLKLVNKIVCHLTDCTKYNKMFVSWCNGRWWRALKSCFFLLRQVLLCFKAFEQHLVTNNKTQSLRIFHNENWVCENKKEIKKHITKNQVDIENILWHSWNLFYKVNKKRKKQKN